MSYKCHICEKQIKFTKKDIITKKFKPKHISAFDSNYYIGFDFEGNVYYNYIECPYCKTRIYNILKQIHEQKKDDFYFQMAKNKENFDKFILIEYIGIIIGLIGIMISLCNYEIGESITTIGFGIILINPIIYFVKKHGGLLHRISGFESLPTQRGCKE